MKKLINALNKPRSRYFLIVAMLTITIVLMQISFSYYVPETVDVSELGVPDLVNVLSIEDNDTTIEFLPNETKELTFHIKSENEIETEYLVSYIGENFSIENLSVIGESIKPFDENTFIIKVTNLNSENNIIKFEIQSGFKNKILETENNIIK